MKFSQRIGKTPEVKQIQINWIDDELCNRLWNIIEIFVENTIEEDNDNNYHRRTKQKYFDQVWHHYFKKPLHSQPNYPFIEIRNYFFTADWFEKYDFIEFILNLEIDVIPYKEFSDTINSILESEYSGYRIIDKKVTPITNEIEITEIKEAKSISKRYPQFPGIDKHISQAIEYLSNREKPDFRNSIKESISAVESTCRTLTGESTLGKSLSKFESKGIKINSELKKGFESIYSYTNSKESGIRHSIVDNIVEPNFSEAKFMLVSCSAFINYIISKSKINH
ncbi:MAG: hypothetical protein IPJ51_24990 [Saprospiraceae bacterium]|nr:hypothetical protein [Saprospiraceae bacterium]